MVVLAVERDLKGTAPCQNPVLHHQHLYHHLHQHLQTPRPAGAPRTRNVGRGSVKNGKEWGSYKRRRMYSVDLCTPAGRDIVHLTLATLNYFCLNHGDWRVFSKNILFTSFRVIWIPVSWVYGRLKYLNFFGAGTVFIRQNLTVPTLKGLKVSIKYFNYEDV